MVCLKIIIIFTQFAYLYYSLKNANYHSKTNTSSKSLTYKVNHFKHSYEYSKIDKQPTEMEEGNKIFICKYCRKNYSEKIPKLSNDNYKTEILTSNCEHGNGIKYYSESNGNFEVTDNTKKLHSIYGKKCDKCQKLIGEFDFKSLGPLKCTGYPRLIRLSKYWNYNWLLGGNFGNNVGCRISKDQGLTWTEPIDISFFPDHVCSNIDLYELPNHDIISSFRAIGKFDNHDLKKKYNRKLGCSISHDGGYTWKSIGNIIDNYELAKKMGKTKHEAIKAVQDEDRVGFFEPFVMLLNNKISVFYADDFTPMLNHTINDDPYYNYMVQNIYTQTYSIENQKWSEDRELIMDGSLKKSPTGSGLIKRISRDGMPVATTMKDGTYVLIFEGTYRDRDYPLLTGTYLGYHKWFEILMSYSKDGINWSNPVEIYVSKNNGTKSSAPFVLCNEHNQLIVSFQTDEDSYDFGYAGDNYSIMKVMISKPGIPIEKINQDSFYALCNNNNSPIGAVSIWNGMMLLGNTLYTVSSDNTIKYSKLPIYEEPDKYNEILKQQYYVKKGNILTYGDKISTQSEETIIINKNIDLTISNNFYTYVRPNSNSKVELIFGMKNLKLLNKYYSFMINGNGHLTLNKCIDGKNENLMPSQTKYIENYNNNNIYKMEVYFNPFNGSIIAQLDNNIIYSTTDVDLKGNKVGFISYSKNAIITQILAD